MNRTLSAIALSAALLIGSAASADAAPKRLGPVATCVKALKVAHKHPRYEDRAVIICGRTVRTEAQADRLYRWAAKPGNRWALEIIG